MEFEKSVIKNPAGTYHIVGSGIPANLAYVAKDGTPATDKQIADAKRFGPQLAGVKTRTWETRDEAERALADFLA